MWGEKTPWFDSEEEQVSTEWLYRPFVDDSISLDNTAFQIWPGLKPWSALPMQVRQRYCSEPMLVECISQIGSQRCIYF